MFKYASNMVFSLLNVRFVSEQMLIDVHFSEKKALC